MDSAGSDGPQQRTALVGRNFGRNRVEIAALRETHLEEERLLKLTKFKITIALPKKFGSKGFITAVKITKI